MGYALKSESSRISPVQSAFALPFPASSMLMKILLSRSHSAPNMPLGFIRVQNLARFPGKRRVYLEETIGDIFVYRTFTDSKFFCRLPHRCLFFDNIICDFDCPFFDIIFQGKSPEISSFYNLCRETSGHAKAVNRFLFLQKTIAFGCWAFPVYLTEECPVPPKA